MIFACVAVFAVLVVWLCARQIDANNNHHLLELHGLRCEVDRLRREQLAFKRLVRTECAASAPVEELWQRARREAARDG